MGYDWKCFRRWIKKQPSAEEYADKLARLKAFVFLASKGHIDLYFGDEKGIKLIKSHHSECWERGGDRLTLSFNAP